MKIRQTVCSTTLALGLLLGTTACGSDTKTQPPAEQPRVAPTTPKPTPVDPTVAAKAKVLADYKLFIDTQSRGFVSNSPTFPYEQVMTGNALAAAKSVMAGAQMAGLKYSGSARFLKGEVSALNLKAKPATATVRACIFDGLKSTSKRGKVTSLQDKLSREDQMVLVDGRWKASETKGLDKSQEGCA
ncbi:hypothetical protein ACFCV3_13620 [Kribbella sp. NPDC056345]|uniref:hypothetical protein n=1 Tax=Kribbella sp. NPDC056345 TaxID=3345789 RepID=UPI0035E30D6B